MLEGKRLAVVGAGKLGEALVRGLIDAGLIDPARITVTARRPARVAELEKRYRVVAAVSNRDAVRDADVILLSVKPQTVGPVLEEIRPELGAEKLVISVAASVGTGFIEARVPDGLPVIRAMPNTPCLLKQGMTGLSSGARATMEHLETALAIFSAVGRTVVVEEKHMDAITGLSASGPAFIYIVIESLAEAGVKVGLPRDVATELAAQTVLGAGAMVIETGEHPARLKDMVTTPAGCTIDGILELEEGGLRVTLIKAVVKATQRAAELLEKG